jgi:hypothetical protein
MLHEFLSLYVDELKSCALRVMVGVCSVEKHGGVAGQDLVALGIIDDVIALMRYACVCAYVCVCVYVYVCLLVCVCVCVFVYEYMYGCLHMNKRCVYMCIYMCVYVYICMHIYI